MTITITKRELRSVVKDSVKEALETEMMRLRALMMPYISPREQKEIERLYNKPSRETKKTLKINL